MCNFAYSVKLLRKVVKKLQHIVRILVFESEHDGNKLPLSQKLCW